MMRKADLKMIQKTFIQKTFKGALLAGALFGSAMFGSANADAHAISVGFENAGPSAVTVWLGAYNHNTASHHFEGSLWLEGVLGTVFGPVVNPFTIAAGLYPAGFDPTPVSAGQPAGLIDGVTNFYTSTGLNVDGPLVGSDATWLTICPNCGPVDHWQGVTFAGLAAGDYQFTYVPIATPSAEWTPINNSLNGTFNLSGAIINPVPLPGAIGLFGVALAGLGFVGARRARRNKKAA